VDAAIHDLKLSLYRTFSLDELVEISDVSMSEVELFHRH
jgi:hypothetical protein